MTTEPRSTPRRPRLAAVLSGGGARGAYEAGVFAYIERAIGPHLPEGARFDILSGTSIGAIHASFLAGQDPRFPRDIASPWRTLRMSDVYHQGWGTIVELRRLFHSKPNAPSWSLLDPTPLRAMLLRVVDFSQIERNLESRRILALAVSATDMASGQTTVFVDSRKDLPLWSMDKHVFAEPTRIDVRHAMASGAMPLLFPPVEINGKVYCDGGIRQNTPLSPALRLGADRLLVIGLRHVPTSTEAQALAQRRKPALSSPTYLIGKVLNALLLDRVDYDLDILHRFNDLVSSSTSAGRLAATRVNEVLAPIRGAKYRPIRSVTIRPSQDLGLLAGEVVQDPKVAARLVGPLGYVLRESAEVRSRGECDLLSYLLFDSAYADALLELGERDAERKRDELYAFFTDPPEQDEHGV